MHLTFPKTIVAFLAILVSVVCVHSTTTCAVGNNTAGDNFQRPHTAVGWGTTTNKSSLINYSWQRSLGTSNDSYIQSSTGIIVYAGTNGHKIAGYVGVPARLGGDVLARITFTSVGQAVGGVTLQVRGGTSWYQTDMNTASKILELRKRDRGIMTTVASIPFAYSANAPYWVREHVQVRNGVAQIDARAWRNGTAEPSNWQVIYSDTHPLPAGSAGAMGDWLKKPFSGAQIRFNSWSYAANGLASSV
ncbi:MAG TPA: hypothetical protein VGL94_01115 [Ktedonobacteraceae bacterium]|jgi:hypothetical protein